jgi:hypothetical protein
MGFIPSEPFPSAEPCTFRLPYPLAVSDIACSCSEDQKATMPRNSRALLPAKIRTRLKPMRARADTLMGFSTLRQQILSLRAPVARHPPCPHGEQSPRASRSGEQGRDSRRKIGFHRSDQHPKSVHQDLSPGSPDDSSVLSDYSDFK